MPAAGILVGLGIAVAALSYAGGLLPVSFGAWPATEPMIVLLHIGAALAGVGLLLGACLRPASTERALRHPLVLAALAVALWSAAVAPLADYPWLSILGSPQLGEGALYYGEFAVFSAGALALRRFRHGYRTLLATLVAICVAVPAWEGLAAAESAVFVFSDYLAYYGLTGGVLAFALARRFPPATRLAAAAAAAAPGFVLSANATAILVILLLAFPAAVLVHIALRVRAVPARRLRVVVALVAAVLPLAGFVAAHLIGSLDLVASLTSRTYLNNVLMAALRDDAAIAIHGQGWGQTGNTVVRYIVDSGAVIWDGSWDLAVRDVPHSHNLYLEALFGAGLPAVLAVAALLVAAPLTAPRRRLPLAAFAAIGLGGTGALWFQIPGTMALVPVMLGACAGQAPPWRVSVRTRRWRRTIAAALVATVVAGSAGAAVFLARYGVEAGQDRLAEAGCDVFPEDSARGDLGLARIFVQTFRETIERAVRNSATGQDLRRLGALECTVRARLASSGSPRLHAVYQLFLAEIALNPAIPALHAAYDARLEGWEAALRRLLELAPRRSDIAVAYLSWRVGRREWQEVTAMAESLRQVRPRDPVGLWYLGVAEVNGVSDEGRSRGADHLRSALRNGIERLVPVPSGLRDQLLRKSNE